jgi:hypothetical protein
MTSDNLQCYRFLTHVNGKCMLHFIASVKWDSWKICKNEIVIFLHGTSLKLCFCPLPNPIPHALRLGKINFTSGYIVYRLCQEKRSLFWEVIVSVILSKNNVLFRKVSEVELFHCTVPKLLIRKRYYVLFLLPVFIVQVTKLVQFN